MEEDIETGLICINVGGREFWTYYSTLERLPGTTLSRLAREKHSHETWMEKRNCYFYDRSPDAFRSILEYYRTDELHIAEALCGNAMKQELRFWGLSEAEIEPCCWGNYAKYHSHKETLADLESAFGGEDEYEFLEKAKALKNKGTCWERFKRNGWLLLEYPGESILAKVLMFISMAFVIVSILETIMESHFIFRVVYEEGTYSNNYHAAPDPAPYHNPTPVIPDCNCHYDSNQSLITNNSSSDGLGSYPHTEPHPFLSILDDVCMGYFLFELTLRFFFAPNKCTYFKGPLNVIDIICVVPQLISIIIKHTHAEDVTSQYDKAGDFFKAITVLRTVRILRVFKLMKHYSAFKILAYTIKVSTKELLLMVVYLLTGVLIFASIIHYAEQDNFSSIPIGFWWALVTMTTVGYGDKHPKELVGYLIGSLCVMSGVLVIAFTVPIVVNNFSLYYTHAKTRIKLPKETIQDQRRNKSVKNKSSNGAKLVSRLSSNNSSLNETQQTEMNESSADVTLNNADVSINVISDTNPASNGGFVNHGAT